MKKSLLCLLLPALSFCLFCCTSENTDKHKTLAMIDDYNLTLDEFQYQLASEMGLDKDFKLTKEGKTCLKTNILIEESIIL